MRQCVLISIGFGKRPFDGTHALNTQHTQHTHTQYTIVEFSVFVEDILASYSVFHGAHRAGGVFKKFLPIDLPDARAETSRKLRTLGELLGVHAPPYFFEPLGVHAPP